MLRRFVVLSAAVVFGAYGGVGQASTAETQARLAAALPVATQAVSPPPPPVTPHHPTTRAEPVSAPPKPDLPSPSAPPPTPAPRHGQGLGQGLILLLPALIALVAVVRWFARRRRSPSKRV